MEVFSVEEFQERWDELIIRVEEGETLGIVNDKGQSAVMVPASDDAVYKMYTDHNEASWLTDHSLNPTRVSLV